LGLLDSIIATKHAEVAGLRQRESSIREDARATAGRPDFAAALLRDPCVGVIAEVKRRSPSAGAIREEADPVETALLYEKGGASAISVLTDLEYFGGTLGDIERVTSHTKLPVIRKDFIIDELQILEARNAGASAVLLIVRLLGRESLRALRDIAHEAGMVALVEVHDDEELDIAIDSGARIIGVNNRDLDTLTIDLAVSERLIPRIPKGVTAVAESGLRSPDDVRRMADAGADAVLVGEALMRDGTHDGAAAMTCIPRIGRA
jgi:indole-3-glycerol phosphate synthase